MSVFPLMDSDRYSQMFALTPMQCVGYNPELQDDLVAAVQKWHAAGCPGKSNPNKTKKTSVKRESRSPFTSRLRSPIRVKSEPESSDEEITLSDDDQEPLDAQDDWSFVPPSITKSGRAVRQPGRY
jgi:hypothetical protein